MASDLFVRQRSVPGWNVHVIHNQTALLLGVGGIGCTVALALCRLGIKRLYLVDYDVVDVSNLNRQVLFATQDIDRRKVDAAMDGLARHNIQTELVPVHLDAVLEWGKVVEMARKSSVIVNGIDYGEYFDYAVTSLSVSLGCDYVSGSSYGHTVISETTQRLEMTIKKHVGRVIMNQPISQFWSD
ncbi:probable adenylyltransferase/sulfurtransferase MoeZ [Corticium candelabrum]|uniref:probable adenylyltransferase/sulfurtransferase MoeZ n=1 Tax=Corticium candelabrum TaxID=121492 RepID=UPI002E2554A7|nr:probable adenylyltransferase/sulfurtransferase MoeZ [Corticium candelabrum]